MRENCIPKTLLKWILRFFHPRTYPPFFAEKGKVDEEEGIRKESSMVPAREIIKQEIVSFFSSSNHAPSSIIDLIVPFIPFRY